MIEKKNNERKFQFYFKQNLQNDMNKYRQNTNISNKINYILIHSRMCNKRKVFIFKILQNTKSLQKVLISRVSMLSFTIH